MCMTTLDSSSGAESSMDDNSNGRQQHLQSTKRSRGQNGGGGRRRRRGDEIRDGEDEVGEYEECDEEVWEAFSKSFRQVQTVLDQNRVLIQQVNENHQSKIPDNLTKNVSLIREINGNITKVVSLYSDLSVNFSNVFHERRGIKSKGEIPEA